MQKFHPSAKRAWLNAAVGLVLSFVAIFVLLSAFNSPTVQYSVLFAAPIPVLIAAVYIAAVSIIAHLTTYSLENGSLKMERSFISTEQQIIPLKNIDNLRIKISLAGRFLSLADVYIDTPGGDGFEMVLIDIPQPAAEKLAEEVEQLKKGA